MWLNCRLYAIEFKKMGDENSGLHTALTVVYLIWVLSCIIPNIILIWIFSIHKLYQNNFYFIIIIWGLSNIFQTFNSLYKIFVPERFLIDPTATIFLVFHCVMTQILMMLAAAFSFDKFVNSVRYCRKMIYNNLTICGINITVTSILFVFNITNIIIYTITFSSFATITLVVYVTRLIYVCFKRSNEESYPLRAVMAGVCIVTNYSYVIWLLMHKLTDLEISQAYGVVTFVVYSNGFVNLFLLNRYDLITRDILRRKWKDIINVCKRKRSIVQDEEAICKVGDAKFYISRDVSLIEETWNSMSRTEGTRS